MARSSATAAFLLLLLSLLAIAHCRTPQSEPATETTTIAIGDETGPPPTDVLTEAGATEVVPAEQDGFLRLPSHRRHRHPCRHGLFHRHLWWARHHGTFGHGHRFPHRGDAELVRDGEPRVAAEDEEVKLVAEPYPDRSLPNSDGEDGDDAAGAKRWRREMLWRMFRHGLRHHRHHHHEEEEEEDHEREDGGVAGLKRFRHHDDEEEDDEEKQEKMRKLFHFHHHHHEDDEEKMRKPFHHADDSDEDDNELEEMVRRFRKAILRRRFHHHGRFFRHHHQHHAEEAAEQSDGEQQPQERGGVMNWVKGLIMNRF